MTAKFSRVYPEIFDEIRQFFGHVIPETALVRVKQEALLWQRDRTTHLSVEILQLQNIPIVWHYLRGPTFSRFTQYWSVTDTHTQRRTDRYTTTACTALAQRRAVKIDHIARDPQSIITMQATTSVDSKLLGSPRNIWTIMLKLHLIESLSICYTIKFATDTVKNRTDEV